MDIIWEGQTHLGEAKEWYRLLQGAYLEAMQEAYTRVPEELLPGLTAFVYENPREGLEEVSAFIAYTLQDMASYTLTPGRQIATSYPGLDSTLLRSLTDLERQRGRAERSFEDRGGESGWQWIAG